MSGETNELKWAAVFACQSIAFEFVDVEQERDILRGWMNVSSGDFSAADETIVLRISGFVAGCMS